jgi:cation diffusion facilitator family transporter
VPSLHRAAAGPGPHGGPLVDTGRGLVEISVFETGVPPRFRLYFATKEGAAQAPPDSAAVRLETLRPRGERQAFSFVSDGPFLESTGDIPEPHAFTVTITIGAVALPEVRFTEHDHGHGPDDALGHSHHAHEHRSGVLGWLQGTFGHSHRAVDKIDDSMESNARGIWALKVSLVALGLTALLQMVVVVVSGSVGLLADTIHNLADAGTSLPLWLAFALTRRGASRRFTYGYGKTEDVAGVVIVLIIFSSACVAAWESVYKIIHPQPVRHLAWVAAAAVIGFIGNEAVAVLRIRVGREIGSAALVADGQHARVDGFTSLAVLVGAAGVYLGVPLLDPLVGLGITLAILFIVKGAAGAIWIRLIDGIEPEILDAIADAPTHVDGVRAVRSVRARWVGHKVYSDIEIAVDPALRVPEADAIAKAVERSLRDHVRLLGEVVVRVGA